MARWGRNTLNEGAGDHVKQPLTCDRMQERWSASLKQKHCSRASRFWGGGMVGCHGSRTANNHSEQNSGSDLHQLVGSEWRSSTSTPSTDRQIGVITISQNGHLRGSGVMFSPMIHCSWGLWCRYGTSQIIPITTRAVSCFCLSLPPHYVCKVEQDIKNTFQLNWLKPWEMTTELNELLTWEW